jgi:quinoprotein glucose dehydrogenase
MMSRKIYRVVPILAIVIAAGAWMTMSLIGQTGNSAPYFPSVEKGDWPMYTGQINGSRYSPQSQINADNFNKLEVAWRFKTDNLGTKPEFKLEGTPLVVRGTLYTTAGTRRDVVALKADTGELIWVHSEFEGPRAVNSPRQLSGRGLSYWTDGREERIIYVTTGYKMIELDAKTGNRIKTFGNDGILDLKVGMYTGTGKQIELETGEAGLHSAPLILGDRIIVGVAFKEGMTVKTHDNTKGQARAFDVKTGKLIWAFNTIPKKGEFGYDTWENNSADVNGNTGVWTQITADPDLGIVYLPVETPTSDFYGGHRPGNDLFAESIVAVDAKTGTRKWYFQMIHHGIWDHDNSSAPLLADVTIDGKPRKIVAVPTKQSWLYVFDRVTGEPVWPIPEKPMPPSDVPGEKAAPTQPIPSKPPAYARTFVSHDDIIDFTPELRQEGLKNMERYRWIESPYVPYVVGNERQLGSINIGNTNGGTNWPGGSFDPETGIFYSFAGNASITVGSLRTPPEGFSDIKYVSGRDGTNFTVAEGPGYGSAADYPERGGGGRGVAAGAAAEAGGRGGRGGRGGAPAAPAAGAAPGNAAPPAGGGFGGLNVQGLTIVRPPYGVLSAIDMNKGDLLWSVPHGDTPDNVRNHPVVGPILADYLKKRGLPKAGQNGTVGDIVTKTLVILGDPSVTTTPEHPRGAMLRAYDKKTGKEVGAVFMPAPQSGSPMTYMVNGRQYIVVAISGGNYSGEYISFRLPASELPATARQ